MSRWIHNAIDASSRSFGAVIGAMGAMAVVGSVKQEFNSLSSTPNLIKCCNCGFFIPVPNSVWDWRCSISSCGYVNSIHEHSSCAKCGAGKPRFPNPSVPCPQCSCYCEVAGTKFEAGLRRLVPTKRVANPRANIPVAAPVGSSQQMGVRPASAAFPVSSSAHAFPGAPSQIASGAEGAPNEHILFEDQPGEEWTVLKKVSQ